MPLPIPQAAKMCYIVISSFLIWSLLKGDFCMSIRIGIMGYGNLGRGVELAVEKAGDMELKAVFTRREPGSLTIRTKGVPVVSADEAEGWQDKIDVMILCGGSATDLPWQAPLCAQWFNIVDSFDTHATIAQHFKDVDDGAKKGGHIGIISVGWDPGLFSLARVYGHAILPDSKAYTFWGRGVSQGHSDAIRRIKGVKDARQYTVPVPQALETARRGEQADFTPRQMHTRECYVVPEEGASEEDKARIQQEIKTMPHYFDEYDTTVHFITQAELQEKHSGLPHGGCVIRTSRTGKEDEHKHVMEFSLTLDSNPEFTTSVLVAYARAAYTLSKEGQTGCRTVLDIAPSYLCQEGAAELRSHLL